MSPAVETHTAIGLLDNKPSSTVTSFQVHTPKQPGSQQYLVKTKVLGFTPLTLWQADFKLLVPESGLIFGGNLVGEIVAVGHDIRRDDLKAGDWLMAFQFAGSAGRPYQEYVLVEENNASRLPEGLSAYDGATIPDSFVTAYHSLHTELGLPLPPVSYPYNSPPPNPDLEILVWGGASTCGAFTIQLLKAAGYTNIVTTCSPSNFSLMSKFGATKVYSYLEQIPGDEVNPDVVLDCIGDLQKTVVPIAKIVKKSDAKVGILTPVRIGEYGSVGSVTMEVDQKLFIDGVEPKGIRTHFWQRNERLAKELQTEIMPYLFESQSIRPVACRLVSGGSFLEKTQNGLHEFRKGTVRAEKLILEL